MGMEIGDLERMNKLPREIASVDLKMLEKRHERSQWWDEIKGIEGEYYRKFFPKGERNEYLEANIAMAKLKLVVSFLDNEERNLEQFGKYDRPGKDEIVFLHTVENELPQVRRLSPEKLAEYYHNKRLRGELGGFAGLVFDTVQKRSNVVDTIMERSDIPDDLAKAFDRIYEAQIQKIQESLQIMITKWGITGVYEDINSV